MPAYWATLTLHTACSSRTNRLLWHVCTELLHLDPTLATLDSGQRATLHVRIKLRARQYPRHHMHPMPLQLACQNQPAQSLCRDRFYTRLLFQDWERIFYQISSNKHRKSNKMRKQRNMLQMKQQEKNPGEKKSLMK